LLVSPAVMGFVARASRPPASRAGLAAVYARLCEIPCITGHAVSAGTT